MARAHEAGLPREINARHGTEFRLGARYLRRARTILRGMGTSADGII